MKPKDYLPFVRHRLYPYCRDVFFAAYPVEPVAADFYLSLGPDCRTATHLNRNKLRICASPLDWMMCYTLKHAAELFQNGFSTFFADVEELPDSGTNNRIVKDRRNGMISIHHFPFSLTLEEGQKAYREKAARHFSNTHRFMTEADRFAMVSHSTESIDDICRFIGEIRKLYTAEIIFINVRNGKDKKREVFKPANNATLHEYIFEDVSPKEKRGIPGNWIMGDKYEWCRILGKCRRTNKFSPPEKLVRESYN